MCDFPAQSLLAKRRAAFEGKDIDTAMAIICEIDNKRFNHEMATGCKCWQQAIEAEPNPLAPKEAA